jgi:hypothetical protein
LIVIPAPLVAGTVARSHSVPINQGEVTNYHRYRIFSSVPANWVAHINWAGDVWDGVPAQTHPAFIEVGFSHHFSVNKVAIDGQGGVAANMSVLHNGTVEAMKFDTSEIWHAGVGAPPQGPLDLRSIALHEFGHALYLAHSNQSADVMYSPTVPAGQMKRSLSGNDIARMQALY